MQPLFETLMSSVSKALLGGVLSTAIVGVGIFLLVLLVLIPLLLLRTRAGSPGPFITVDMGPGPIAQSGAVPSMPSMPGQVQATPAQSIGQPWNDRRQEWLYKLDS